LKILGISFKGESGPVHQELHVNLNQTLIKPLLEKYKDLRCLIFDNMVNDNTIVPLMKSIIKSNINKLCLWNNTTLSMKSLKLIAGSLAYNKKLEHFELVHSYKCETLSHLESVRQRQRSCVYRRNEQTHYADRTDTNFNRNDIINIICSNIMYNKTLKTINIRSFYQFEDRTKDFKSFLKCQQKNSFRERALFTFLCCLKFKGFYTYTPKYIRKMISIYFDIYCIDDKISCLREIYRKDVTIDTSILPYKFIVTDL